jgi:hypothetical protein
MSRHEVTIVEHGANRMILFARCNDCDWEAGPHRRASMAAKVEAHKIASAPDTCEHCSPYPCSHRADR